MKQTFMKGLVSVLAAAIFLLLPAGSQAADTWRLDDQGQWKPASGSKEEEFLLRAAQIKKLADSGQPQKVRKAAGRLKADFPQTAGADFDSFIEAEVLLAKGKLTKAVRQYDKFLDEYPGSFLRDAAMEREFDIAGEYLAGRKKTILLVISVHCYDEGVKIMEKISDRAGSADIAKRASLAVVQSYEKRRQYDEAYLKWSQIQTVWPTGQLGKDALLGMARNKYATFRGPEYDGSGLISAKSYYENFKLRYPEDAQRIKVDEILLRINEQLAEKNLRIAKYYSRTGSELPANMYNQMVVDNWPNTKAAETARQEISKK